MTILDSHDNTGNRGGRSRGWWASQGVRDRYGCLAGLVLGLLVAAGLIAAMEAGREREVGLI
jgi:hypothetical protein